MPLPGGTPARAFDDKCRQIERWFVTQGVPHFAEGYSSKSRIPLLVYVLFAVLAFQVGIAPWLELGAPQLLLAPPILFLLSLWIIPAMPNVMEINPGSVSRWWSLPLRLSVLGIAAYLLARSELPPMWSEPWIDFAVIFGVLASSALLFQQQVWAATGEPVVSQRRQVVATVVVAIVLFGLEGSLFASFSSLLGDAGMSFVPQALPALIVVALVLLMAMRLTTASAIADTSDDFSDPLPPVLVATVPLLVLVLGAETAVLPHAAPDGWMQAIPMMALLLVGCLSALAWWQGARRPSWGRFEGSARRARAAFASRIAGLAWVGLFLFSYPLIAGLYLDIHAFGYVLSGFAAFTLAFSINGLYLAVAWFTVSFGLDHVGSWTYRTAFEDMQGIGVGLVRGLPLLLVFAAFLVLQAELWQVVVEIDTVAYLVLLGLPVILALTLIAITSVERIGRQCHFERWRDIFASAHGDHQDDTARMVAGWLESVTEEPAAPAPAARLSPLERANASIVLMAYQALILIPVAAAAAVLFWSFAKLAVPPEVAGEWVYGDRSPPELGQALADRQFLDEPWTRVAGLLAGVSLLYLAVTVLANPEQRRQFFEAADSAMAQRLAVRAIYRTLRGQRPAPRRRFRAFRPRQPSTR